MPSFTSGSEITKPTEEKRPFFVFGRPGKSPPSGMRGAGMFWEKGMQAGMQGASRFFANKISVANRRLESVQYAMNTKGNASIKAGIDIRAVQNLDIELTKYSRQIPKFLMESFAASTSVAHAEFSKALDAKAYKFANDGVRSSDKQIRSTSDWKNVTSYVVSRGGRGSNEVSMSINVRANATTLSLMRGANFGLRAAGDGEQPRFSYDAAGNPVAWKGLTEKNK